MKNFSVQYLLSHIDNKKDVPTPPPIATTLNVNTSVDVGKKIKSNIVFFYCVVFNYLEDDNHSSVSLSFYDSSNDEDDEQQILNQNPIDSGTTSEDSETSKYLRQEHIHHHETSKRRKRRVLFSKQQTFELERRFRQQRYLSGKKDFSISFLVYDFYFI